jgi:hypothetical protein
VPGRGAKSRWIGLGPYARRHGAAGNAEVIHGDARQLGGLLPPGTAGTAALIVTSPPYGPSIHGQVKAEARSGGGKVTKWDNTYVADPATWPAAAWMTCSTGWPRSSPRPGRYSSLAASP